MNINPISINFLNNTAAPSIANSKGAKKNRIELKGLDNKIYFVAANSDFKQKKPALNSIQKRFNDSPSVKWGKNRLCRSK